MKKTSKIMSAVALSAALAIGTAMPAFAATTSKGTEGEMEMDGSAVKTEEVSTDGESGETSVHMKTEVSNISVTVPVKAYLYAETVGGNLGTPSKTAYRLVNTSTTTDAYIRSIAVDNTAASEWLLTTDTTKVGAGVQASGVTCGNILVNMAIEYKNSGNQTMSEPAFALDTAAAKTLTKTDGTFIPHMPKNNGEINIDLSGQSSMLNDQIADGATTQEAFKITYTVSANPSNTIA